MTTLPDAFYHPDRDRFVSTELTRGPWSDAHQHGGPPAALLSWAVEAMLPRVAHGPAQIVRASFDFVRPVPIAPLTVSVNVVRSGRRAHELAGTLSVDRDVVVRGSFLCLRTAEVGASTAPRVAAPPPPADCPPFAFPFFTAEVGYHRAFEARRARGEFGAGAMAVWFRLLVPLLAGEAVSPLERVVVAADSGNGVSVGLDMKRFTFVNPELTLHLHRPLIGEWICLDAATTAQPNGVGLTETALFDESGPIGRGSQALLVASRD